ncbi:pilus assembly protein [Salmonella enterica subsp. enterica serovar Hull]|uniref:Pilus assembly protein n=1 Tax=Salmonella enterica subsp. enterica serovar Hull TaxID=1403564 RepID=A0A5X4PLQ0_SALET|nr:pilus assembly protein [Salmonella enterica subsp. enterica serovar Putten]EBZ7588781.1 pilus assembly protein [Salmonella enterica subsp. enterica serovar Hull]EBZ8651207.1 pilus assembly protein [Salmonella enterica subsp. enterica serovar Hull]EEB7450879.1 tyrosine-type recombinase/integrase [Salmonella enterica subsp. enterica serovar Emek]
MSTRKFLTRHEILAMLKAVADAPNPERNLCFIMMAFIHGFRASEILTLQLADLDLRGRVIQVTRMKNGFSTIHPLSVREVKALKKWLRIRAQIILHGHHEDRGQLFISLKGKSLSRQQFYNIIRQAGRRAGLSVNAHPHMLRHACGYALADNGVDTRLIQDYLGHRNIRHTVRYTASSAARFEGIWQPIIRQRKQHSDPKCKPLLQVKNIHVYEHKITIFKSNYLI